MTDDKVQVRFGADTQEAEAGVDKVHDKLKDLGQLPRELLESFGELRKTFIEAFAVREVAEFIGHIAELGEQAVRSSQMLGISVEQVQELGFAAKSTGGSADGMQTAFERLERNMAEAQSGTGKAYEAFKNLGITLEDLKTKSPDQVIGMIADSFHGAEDGANKTAYAMDLMGRSGAELIPLLNQGSEGLAKFKQAADETGSVLTGSQAEGLEKTAQGLVALKASVEGAGISLFEVFHPAIDATIGGLTQLVQWVTQVINDLRALSVGIEGSIVVEIAGLVEKFETWKVAGSAAIEAIRIGFVTLGQVIDDVVTLHFSQAVADWEAGSRRIVAAEKNAAAEIANIGAQYETYKQKILDAVDAVILFGTASEKEKKNILPPAPTGKTPQEEEDTGDLDDAKNTEATKIALAKLGFDQQKELDDAAVASGKLSTQQKIENLESYAGLQFQIENDALEREKSLYSEGEVEYDQVLNKQKVLFAQYNVELTKLSAQAAQEQQKDNEKTAKAYQAGIDLIGKDFDTMLQGVLQGTQTWEQAMTKMFDNLALSFIEAVAKMIAKWLAFEAITAAFGPVQGLASPLSGGLGNIAGSAFGLKSYDVGSWSVPQTGAAMIHQGEIILPPDVSAGVRSGNLSIGGGGGGSAGSFTVNVNAIDTQTGAQFLKQNAPAIAQALSSQMRLGNSSLRQ